MFLKIDTAIRNPVGMPVGSPTYHEIRQKYKELSQRGDDDAPPQCNNKDPDLGYLSGRANQDDRQAYLDHQAALRDAEKQRNPSSSSVKPNNDEKVLPFYQTASTMKKVALLFFIVGVLGLIAAGGSLYLFRATHIATQHADLFLAIIITGGVLSIVTIGIGIYILRKPYWKDKNYWKEKEVDTSSVEAVLQIPNLPHLVHTAIDPEPLTAQITQDLLHWKNFGNANILQKFVEQYGWRVFELGMVTRLDKLNDGSTVKECFLDCYNKLTLDERKVYTAQLNLYDFKVGHSERWRSNTVVGVFGDDFVIEKSLKKLFAQVDLPLAHDDHEIDVQTINEALNDWIVTNNANIVNFVKEFGWKPFELGYIEMAPYKDAFEKSMEEADDAFVKANNAQLLKYGLIAQIR